MILTCTNTSVLSYVSVLFVWLPRSMMILLVDDDNR